jgi:ribonuclease HI
MEKPPSFLKMNFDKASKGNPGPVGYGVIFKDEGGNICNILAGSLGHDTNNSVELWGLLRGIQEASQQGYCKLIVEGDSQIIINMFSKLLHGSEPMKLSPRWRLLSQLELLQSLLLPHQVYVPSHVRREDNNIVDKLANVGVDSLEGDILLNNDQSQSSPFLQECIEISLMEGSPPDGVSNDH